MKFYLIAFNVIVPLCFIGCVDKTEENKTMEIEQYTIENIRTQYESQIMAISGVVFIGVGLCNNDKPCLKIGTSVPTENVRSELPKGIFKVDVELEFVGEITGH
jgi:uncharacterized secreted protein with C-terminal beta-propeller domain